MKLKDIYGVWRHTNKNIIIDFRVRVFDAKTGKGLSFFTIYGKDENGEDVNYEWQGAVVELIDNGDTTYTISIDEIQFTEDKPEYQELKIWMLTDDGITLELGNGDKVEFKKLG